MYVETKRKHRQIARLWKEQEGRCKWCGCDMVLPANLTTKWFPKNTATLDHLDDRLSGERGKHQGQIRRVLACKECNETRSKAAQNCLSREELWERSGSYPRDMF